MAVTKLVMPGPFWAMHTPCRPLARGEAVRHMAGALLVQRPR